MTKQDDEFASTPGRPDPVVQQVRRAARFDQATIERVVRAVLDPAATSDPGRHSSAPTTHPWPHAFVLVAACLVAAVSLAVWWCARQPGVLSPPLVPAQVISVQFDDGTTWILSMAPGDEWPPQGTGLVAGSGGKR